MVATRASGKVSHVSPKREAHMKKMRNAAALSRKRKELERLEKRVEYLKEQIASSTLDAPADTPFRGTGISKEKACADAARDLRTYGDETEDGTSKKQRCSQAARALRTCTKR